MNKLLLLVSSLLLSMRAFAHEEGSFVVNAIHHWFAAHHGASGLIVGLIIVALFILRKHLLKK